MSQKVNFRLLITLIRQLRAFGLNPREWRIDRSSFADSKIQMYNRFDHDFRFDGNVLRSERGDWILANLRLSSL